MVTLVAEITGNPLGENLDLSVVPPLESAIYLIACGTSFIMITTDIDVATPIIRLPISKSF